jgi:hypothetical protein
VLAAKGRQEQVGALIDWGDDAYWQPLKLDHLRSTKALVAVEHNACSTQVERLDYPALLDVLQERGALVHRQRRDQRRVRVWSQISETAPLDLVGPVALVVLASRL